MTRKGFVAPTAATDINRVIQGAHPEIRKLLKLAHCQGYRVSLTGGHHYKITTPAHYREAATVFSPSTPSDIRGIRNVRQKLRHIGVDIPRS